MTSSDVPENLIVTTSTGKVRGKKTESMYGHIYYYFDGIPYAKPPLGELRFKATEPISKWSGIRDCTKARSKCVQWNRRVKEFQGSEDCLYLNVNVKKFNARPRLPVMVYIHGGGHCAGDPSRNAWSPDYFMMKDVVFITMGYRMGLVGLASFKDKSLGIPGNCGIKDIVLALKWIKDNCSNFNGDPDNITLFGHSSGSVDVHILMQCPSVQGLFHKAILMAGFHMTLSSLPKLEYRIAKHLGFSGQEDDEQAIYKYLSQVEATQLIPFDIFSDVEKLQYPFITIYAFAPQLETYVDETTVIAQDPVIAQRSSWSNDIPIMMGCTSQEALFTINNFKGSEEAYNLYRKFPKYMLSSNWQSLPVDEQVLEEMATKIRDLHFGDKEFCSENYECGIEMKSYNTYHEQHRLIQSRLKYAKAPTYVYRFDFDSPTCNYYRNRFCSPDVKGAGHVDELGYIFKLPESIKLDSKSLEYKCILQMIETFYAFAKSSDPNNNQLQPIQWNAVQAGGVPICLNISNKGTTVTPLPEYDKCCARDDILKMAGVELF